MKKPFHIMLAICIVLFSCRPAEETTEKYMNLYILEAVDYLYADYRLLGYSTGELTHNIDYGPYGTITGTDGSRTNDVAAMMEVILTAMQLYAEDTGSNHVYDYLPIDSWENLGDEDIKNWIWIDHDVGSYGTSSALDHFGMGESVSFEQLQPGAFIHLNRTTGTGHAVVFISFLDINGNEYDFYTDEVEIIGFKYFSSQGAYNPGAGGLDYRYAVFDDYGSPVMPGLRDLHVIYSEQQNILNTGQMLMPVNWNWE